MITIDLVEAAPRILGGFSEKVSERVTSRLRSLGVNVLANRILLRSESWTIFLRDMELGAKTLVWTAGVRNNSFYKNLSEHFEFDGKGRVIVDEFLQAKGFEDIFVAGDNASTKFSGLAQTALFDGSFVAQTVLRKSQKKTIKKYQAQPVSYDVPVGPGWAVLVFKGKPFFGWVPWMMRHIIDFRFYVSILPFFKAWNAFFSGRQNILSTIPIQEKKKETSPKTS